MNRRLQIGLVAALCFSPVIACALECVRIVWRERQGLHEIVLPMPTSENPVVRGTFPVGYYTHYLTLEVQQPDGSLPPRRPDAEYLWPHERVSRRISVSAKQNSKPRRVQPTVSDPSDIFSVGVEQNTSCEVQVRLLNPKLPATTAEQPLRLTIKPVRSGYPFVYKSSFVLLGLLVFLPCCILYSGCRKAMKRDRREQP